MPSDQHARIRERAHKIWLEEGQLDGRDVEHWHRAEREIAAEDEPAEAKTPKRAAAKNGADKAEKTPAAKPARSRATARSAVS